MLDLALHASVTPVFVKDIARRQNISRRYLEHLMLTLKKAGLVRSRYGAKGGYALARDPASIRVRAIVEALEGALAPVECLNNPKACGRTPTCAARVIWTRLYENIIEVLDSKTLAELASLQREKSGAGQVYDI
jgi:Rrf2 family protein